MKHSIKRGKKWIAWGVSISLMLGVVSVPFSGENVKAADMNRKQQEASAAFLSGSGTVSTSPMSEEKPEAPLQTLASPNPAGTLEPTAFPEPTGSLKPTESSKPTESLKPTESPKPTESLEPTESPEPTATVYPVLMQNPNASVLLGSQTDEDVTAMTLGDTGAFDIDRSNTEQFSSYVQTRLTKIVYRSNNNAILQVDENGNYQAAGIGQTTITVTGYDQNANEYFDETLFEKTYTIYVHPDMSGVTLAKESVIIYLVPWGDTDISVSIKFKSDYILDEGNEGTMVDSVSLSNDNMYVGYRIENNILTLESDTPGSTKIKMVINGKEFVIQLKVKSIKLSATSVLLVKGKTKTLKVKGVSETITWKSSRSKKVTVNSKGKIKAKSEGNAIITAKVAGKKLGCVVSVTTARKKKAISRAMKIASTSTYSQARRMQSGYYDCSSLVWRAYSPYGYKIGGASSYAPVAADQARWFAGRNRLLQGGFSKKNVQNLKINAGDLLFKTGANNGRYRGIYHVEMFVGYEFYGFDSKGNAVVVSKWANRSDGYYPYGVGIIGRV